MGRAADEKRQRPSSGMALWISRAATCGTIEEVVPFHRRSSVNMSFDALDGINDGLQRGLMSIVAPHNVGQDRNNTQASSSFRAGDCYASI